MDRSKTAVRYAKALFSLGKESGETEKLHVDFQTIFNLCRSSVDFIKFLENPLVRTSWKKEALQKLLQPHISALAMDFILLIAENKREMEIPAICRNFIDLVRSDLGIIPATVTTAAELGEDTLDTIRRILEKESGKTVELSGKVNPSIIGGMIVKIEDYQFDGSISTQLKKVKSAMLGNK